MSGPKLDFTLPEPKVLDAKLQAIGAAMSRELEDPPTKREAIKRVDARILSLIRDAEGRPVLFAELEAEYPGLPESDAAIERISHPGSHAIDRRLQALRLLDAVEYWHGDRRGWVLVGRKTP